MTRPSRMVIATLAAAACLLSVAAPAAADSTSPRLAAYYDRKMLLCGGTAYQWSGNDAPKPVANDIAQVGVGRGASYALTSNGFLLTWENDPERKREILGNVTWFAAGRSGLFAARTNGDLAYVARPKSWFGEGDVRPPVTVAAGARTASVGDSANYFVSGDGTLFVKGLAHRGQYGDGRLKASDSFVPVARDVIDIKAHTGHAILLKRDGTVMGTGGNIFGPLGRHGLGDKAVSWGVIFRDATAIATGSSHSLAINRDGTLWHWGRGIGLDPREALENVVAAAADRTRSIALLKDGSVWQWERDAEPVRHFRCPSRS